MVIRPSRLYLPKFSNAPRTVFEYLLVTGRSLWIGLLVTIATLIVAYPVAYFLATTTARRRGIQLVLLLIPWWCSILVKNFAWIALLGILQSTIVVNPSTEVCR